jgi:hypothetical protein
VASQAVIEAQAALVNNELSPATWVDWAALAEAERLFETDPCAAIRLLGNVIVAVPFLKQPAGLMRSAIGQVVATGTRGHRRFSARAHSAGRTRPT